MNFEEIRYQQIEDYLKGKLSKEETVSFEKNIASDKNLAEEVAVQKVALQSLEMAYMQSMSTLIRNRVQKNNTIKKYWIGGGALLLTGLLVGSSYLVFTSAPKVTAKNESIINIEKNSVVNSTDGIINRNKSNTGINPEAQRNKKATVSLADSSSLTYQKNNEPVHAAAMHNSESAVSEIKTNKQAVVSDTKIEHQQNTSQITCPEHAPEITVQITPSSYDEESGSIHINMTDKWNVYLKGVNTTYENKKTFTDLSAGTYTLYVKNENNCIFQIGSYTVTNSNCSFEKNYVFNKQFDTEWKIPAMSGATYKVSILNKGGMEVFSENVPAYGSTSWNGLNKNGEKAAIGLHKVIVTYPDNKTCIYNVVVSE